MDTDITEQIEWISRLVSFDTTSSKSNLEMIGFLEEYFSSHDIRTFRVESDDRKKSNLYAVAGPLREGGIVLSGHTDVVPVTDQNWSSCPWTVVRKNGRLYGRGVADMKSFLAICLSLLPAMLEADLAYPVIFAFSYDEETGCLGAPRMIEKIRENIPPPRAVIVGEPTLMNVINGHKGISSFRVTVKGHTTHSSQTDRGVSAVEAAARLVSAITDMRLAGAACADPDSPFSPPYSTMTVNVMHGGVQLNIMAGEAVFEWDLRLVPGESRQKIIREFTGHVRKVEAEMQKISPECSILVEEMTNAPPLSPRSDNPAADFVKAVSGRNSTGVVPYATEAGQFQEAGMPTVVCGPGSIDQAHQPDEYISLEQVRAGTAFMRRLVRYISL